jgi:hypothetical protein
MTTTFGKACPAGDWTEVHDGSAAVTIGIQNAGGGVLFVAVASSKPAVDLSTFDDYFLLGEGGARSMNDPRSASLDLADGEKLYAYAMATDGKVRGYKVTS